MSEDMLSARRSLPFISGSDSRELRGHYAEAVRVIARALDEIKVPRPPVAGKSAVGNWIEFLIRIQAEAKIRNIRCARAIWKEMQGEQKD